MARRRYVSSSTGGCARRLIARCSGAAVTVVVLHVARGAVRASAWAAPASALVLLLLLLCHRHVPHAHTHLYSHLHNLLAYLPGSSSSGNPFADRHVDAFPRGVALLTSQPTIDSADGASRAAALRNAGVTVIPVPGDGASRLCLRSAMGVLRRDYALRSVMIEGGAQVIKTR